MAWSKDVWCVLTVIKFVDKLEHFVVLSIHRDKADALELIGRSSRIERYPTISRLMKYTRYIRDLKEGDVLCCYKIDMIVNYLERESNCDDARNEVRETGQPDLLSRGD